MYFFFSFFVFYTVSRCEGDHSECLYAECIVIGTLLCFFFYFCNSVLLLADGEAQSLSKTALLNVNVLNCVPSVAALAQVSV